MPKRYVVLLQQGPIQGQEVIGITEPLSTEAEKTAARQRAGIIRDQRNNQASGFHLAWDVELLPIPDEDRE